jgi:hypothetical protein
MSSYINDDGLRFMRRLVTTLGALAVLVVGMSAPATAGGDRATSSEDKVSVLAGGPCGSSYSHIGHYRIPRQTQYALRGYLDVYWSSTTKRNCLVTNKGGSTYGVGTYTYALIKPSGFVWPNCPSYGCDKGVYFYYAGPVYTPSGKDMSNECIDISGGVSLTTSTSGLASRTEFGIHCG